MLCLSETEWMKPRKRPEVLLMSYLQKGILFQKLMECLHRHF